MAIHPQSTVVRLDRLPYARQAESRAVDASNVTPATERFEHEWQITSWNSEALVGNAEHGPGPICVCVICKTHLDAAAARTVFDGIPDQVTQHPFDLDRVPRPFE